MSKCVICGKDINPIEAILSVNSGKCGKCIREIYKQIVR